MGLRFGTGRRHGIITSANSGGGVVRSPYRFVLPRGQMATGFKNNAAVSVNVTTTLVRTFSTPPSQVQLVYYNGALNNDYSSPAVYGEQFNTNPVSLRAAVELMGASPVTTKAAFSGADSSGLQAGGAITLSDPITGWAANKFYAIRTETTLQNLNDNFPNGWTGGASVNPGGGARTDQTLSGAPAVTADQVYATGQLVTAGGLTNLAGNVPVAMIGTYAGGFATGQPSAMYLGDSIASISFALVENYFTTNGGSFLDRTMRTNNVCYAKAAIGAGRAIQWTGNTTCQRYLMQFAGRVYWQYGTNDFGSGDTLANIYSYMSAAYNSANSLLVPQFYAMTMIPRGSSSNSYVDSAGQTAATPWLNGGIVDQYKTMIQAGPGFSTDAHAVALRDASDHTLWLTNGVANTYVAANDAPSGIHPTDAGHTLAGTALNTEVATIPLS